MIGVAREPEAALLRRKDIMDWLPGLTRDQWVKIRPHLEAVRLPGIVKPFYRRAEVAAKLVEPIRGQTF